MTKYLNDKSDGTPFINRDIVVAGSNWTEDADNTEYSCKYCRRTMSKTKIIDSSHQNPSFSLYCSFCGILSEIEEDTRKKSKVKVHKGKITEPAVSYAPELTLKRKTVEYKGGTKVLSQKGSIRITGYNEGKGQVNNGNSNRHDKS
jgi:hypothetical protein